MPTSESLNDDFKSGASRRTAASRSHLSRLTVEEKRTYQKWKRATFIVYGTAAIIIVMLSIAIGPTDKGSIVKSEMYSSLGPAAGKSR